MSVPSRPSGPARVPGPRPLLGAQAGAVAAPPRPAPSACRVVVDPARDETIEEAALDLRSADFASDARRLTAVIRVGGDPHAPATTSPMGRRYTIRFEGGAAVRPVMLSYLVTPTTRRATYGYYHPESDAPIDAGQADVKVGPDYVALTVPLIELAVWGRFAPGYRIKTIEMEAQRAYGVYSEYGTQDATGADFSIGGKASYLAASRSCVRVGG